MKKARRSGLDSMRCLDYLAAAVVSAFISLWAVFFAFLCFFAGFGGADWSAAGAAAGAGVVAGGGVWANAALANRPIIRVAIVFFMVRIL